MEHLERSLADDDAALPPVLSHSPPLPALHLAIVALAIIGSLLAGLIPPSTSSALSGVTCVFDPSAVS